MTSFHCDSFILRTRVSRVMPALFTRTETGSSHLSAVALKSDLIPAELDMSAPTAIASPPEDLICSTTSSAAADELA